MGSVPFAFSAHQFVSSVGADAGFAAIIGLAILVMLYFAQARETANLREQAYEAAQRVGQLEARITQLTRQAPAAATAATPNAARRPAGVVPGPAPAPSPLPARVPMVVGAPAGVAAPALAAATRLIPVRTQNGPDWGGDWPADPIVVTQAQPEDGATAAPAPAPVPAPAPMTVAGAANGTSHERVSSPPPPPRPLGGQARAANRPDPSAAPRRPLLAPEPEPRRSPAVRILAGLVGLAVVAGAVVALLLATSGKSTKPPASASRSSNAPTAGTGRRTVAFNPRSVTVAVLNGTGTTGLAHRTALRLDAAGYKQGTVATASDQTLASSLVSYLPGFKTDAARVAGSLRLPPASVKPIDPGTQAVACPPPAACTAHVVVTVGAELAQQQ